MKDQPFTTTVNGFSVTCNPNLEGFKIFKKPSSHVDFFATHKEGGQLFIQFTNGKCYVYGHVPKETLDLVEGAESVGKAYYAFIKGKYPEQEVEDCCVIPVAEPDEDEDDWDMNHFPDSVDFDI